MIPLIVAIPLKSRPWLLRWNRKLVSGRVYGHPKATRGSSEEHQEGSKGGEEKTNSETSAEENAASARTTGRQSEKITTRTLKGHSQEQGRDFFRGALAARHRTVHVALPLCARMLAGKKDPSRR